ncbi:MAG: acetyl-CoA carboxylase carboxyl transferase subunit alpha [Spirochaetae bacterium HGW-Spirochaetae-6]|jgi:acetyl-CoA carboxylase carboxyl transferase subunit alpha|nr:MAG: acetyl-CoA carboxylase carboxyl transferase subunit alpha [Spirochaetae bacterium HGW-Spirochaetae-6]
MVLDFERSIAEIEEKILLLKKKEDHDSMSGNMLEALEASLKNEIDKVYNNLDPWKITQIARHFDRPTFLDYVKLIFTDFVELHGDRSFFDDKALVGGMAKLDGEKVFILGHQKGRDMNEAKMRNFGMPRPEGYRKALRIMEMASKFNRPILTFIDTPGAYPGLDAEERGQGEAIARNLREMAKLQVPVIATVIGEGGSGGALGISVANKILMLKYAIYSVISPEGCASILYRDSTKASEAAKALRLTADNLVQYGICDGIIEEPKGGAHRFMKETAQNMKAFLIDALKELNKVSRSKISDKRIDKFLNIGVYSEKALKY